MSAALLVLAHETAPLQCLLDVLDPRFAVFIHLDAKAEAGGLRLPAQARLLQRTEVFWGGWTMMQATLALIEAALQAGPFSRLALVSGDSLPLRAPDALVAALAAEGREYIELLDVADDPGLAGMPMDLAVARHGWVQPWRFQNRVAWDHLLLNPASREAAAARFGIAQDRMDWVRGEAQAIAEGLLAGMPPRPRLFDRLSYGAQWWALSRDVLAGLLPMLRRPEMTAYFRHMQAPDEHMIQTALANRPDLLAGRVLAGTPMFVDHAARATGRDWIDAAGLRSAAGQGAQLLFARKFRPERAPDVAAAIGAGRYEAEVLAG